MKAGRTAAAAFSRYAASPRTDRGLQRSSKRQHAAAKGIIRRSAALADYAAL